MLHPIKFGVAGGILWGVALFVFTILAIYTGYPAHWLSLLSSIYPGYTVSWVGSFVGLFYGFVDAFVSLYIFAWIYNKLPIK